MVAAVRTTVLIATRDRPPLLRECLDSLAACDLGGAEVLILDQSGGTESAGIVRAAAAGGAPFRHVPLDTRGKSKSLNAGIAMARGDVIMVTDDDCVVAPGWLHAFHDVFENEGGDGRVLVTGRVLPGRHAPDGTPPPSCIEEPRPSDYSGRPGREVMYQNWAVPRRAFEEVGPFDERLGPGAPLRNAEDNDMAYRLLRAGYRILYRPQVVVWHNGWRSREGIISLKWDYGVGQGAFYVKHICRGDLHIAGRFARDALRLARHAATSLLRGDPHASRGNATFLAGLLTGGALMAPRAFRRTPWDPPVPRPAAGAWRRPRGKER